MGGHNLRTLKLLDQRVLYLNLIIKVTVKYYEAYPANFFGLPIYRQEPTGTDKNRQKPTRSFFSDRL